MAAPIAAKVVAHGSSKVEPVSPQVVASVQKVSDLMHQIGSLPVDVQVASVADSTVYQGK